MMAWMYILKCSDGTYYVGSTTELAVRIREHEDGMGSRYTAQRRPVELVYSCEFASIVHAYEAENQVKGWSRAKKEALMRGEWDLLPKLSERRGKNR
ncbi:MAG: GIY-YIG nuclease family protein [Dehalococcoidia bacterium]|nr:GIY-YIG nuclease family protein [Dehalococcoidia bacterium]